MSGVFYLRLKYADKESMPIWQWTFNQMLIALEIPPFYKLVKSNNLAFGLCYYFRMLCTIHL